MNERATLAAARTTSAAAQFSAECQMPRGAISQACRTPAVRKEVADAVLKAILSVKSADVSPNNLVVRFSESVDGFPLPKGFSENPELQAPQK